MTIIQKTMNLYTFEDLPTEDAKEVARDWLKECVDSSDFDCVIDDAREIGALFGFTINNIWWCGFDHPDQCAVCEGYYSYQTGSLAAVKKFAPMDTELHDMVKRLFAIQRRGKFGLCAEVTQSNRSFTTGINVWQCTAYGNRTDIDDLLVDNLTEFFKDFASWVFEQLGRQDEYLHSNEYLDDMLISNDYTFDEKGNYHAV